MISRIPPAPLIGYQLDDDPRSINPGIFEVDDEAWELLEVVIEKAVGDQESTEYSQLTLFMRDLVMSDVEKPAASK